MIYKQILLISAALSLIIQATDSLAIAPSDVHYKDKGQNSVVDEDGERMSVLTWFDFLPDSDKKSFETLIGKDLQAIKSKVKSQGGSYEGDIYQGTIPPFHVHTVSVEDPIKFGMKLKNNKSADSGPHGKLLPEKKSTEDDSAREFLARELDNPDDDSPELVPEIDGREVGVENSTETDNFVVDDNSTLPPETESPDEPVGERKEKDGDHDDQDSDSAKTDGDRNEPDADSAEADGDHDDPNADSAETDGDRDAPDGDSAEADGDRDDPDADSAEKDSARDGDSKETDGDRGEANADSAETDGDSNEPDGDNDEPDGENGEESKTDNDVEIEDDDSNKRRKRGVKYHRGGGKKKHLSHVNKKIKQFFKIRSHVTKGRRPDKRRNESIKRHHGRIHPLNRKKKGNHADIEVRNG